MINAVVAVDKNWGIGKNNHLLFSSKKDMQYFKDLTINKIVVMGENTFLSLPNKKPLKNRTNIVLCPEGHEYENCICFHDFDKLVSYCKEQSKNADLFVIGGGMLYKSMLPHCDKVYVTKIDLVDQEASVFFPNLDTQDSDFYLIDETFEKDIINGKETKINFTIYKQFQI